MYSRSVGHSLVGPRAPRAIGLLACRRAEGAGALWMLLLLALPAAAQINGVIVNQTTGQPQPNTPVTLTRMTAAGPQNVGETKTGSDGKFAFTDSVQGPTLVRAAWDGVTYNKVLPPGTPSTNLTVDVYQSSKAPGDAKVSKHMILFEPGGGQMIGQRNHPLQQRRQDLMERPRQRHAAFLSAAGCRLQAADQRHRARTACRFPRPLSKSPQPNVYKTDFPVKPGETRFDLTYSFPYKIGDQLEGKVVTKDENTYLIVPNGVTLTGRARQRS